MEKKLTLKQRRVISLLEDAQGAIELIFRIAGVIPDIPTIHGTKEAKMSHLPNAITTTSIAAAVSVDLALKELRGETTP